MATRFKLGLNSWVTLWVAWFLTMSLRVRAVPTGLQFQMGDFNVETLFIPSFTANSATTCTATSGLAVVMATVPVWTCTSCPSHYNAVLVSPKSIWGPSGIPSPPPNYLALSVGRDMQVTPVSVPSATGSLVGSYRYVNSTTSAISTSPITPTSSTTVFTPIGAPTPQFTNSTSAIGSKSDLPPNSPTSSSITTSYTPSNSHSPPIDTNTRTTTKPTSPNAPLPTGMTSGTASTKATPSPQNSNSNGTAPNTLIPQLITTAITTSGPGGVSTNAVPVIIGGQITSPIPATLTKTIDPSGSEAHSSAQVVRSSLIAIIPVIQNFINNPSKNLAEDAINAIKPVETAAEDLFSEIAPKSSGNENSCSASTNLITDLFNAVSCVVDNLSKTATDITNGIDDGFSDMGDIVSTLANLKNLEQQLDNSKPSDQPSQSQSASSSTTSKSCTSSTTTVDLYVGCFATPAPGRTGVSATSCRTSTSTITGCDLTAFTTTTISSCTSMQTASDCQVVCPIVTTASGFTSTISSQSCNTTCTTTFSGCSATGTTSTTTSTSVAACSLPSAGSGAASFPAGPLATAWFDYGVFCEGACPGISEPPSGGSTTASTTSSSPGFTPASTNTTPTNSASPSGSTSRTTVPSQDTTILSPTSKLPPASTSTTPSATKSPPSTSTPTPPPPTTTSKPPPPPPTTTSKPPPPPPTTTSKAPPPPPTTTSQPPPPPPPPYATGRCNIHVWQGLGNEVGQADVYLEVNITDAKGTLIGSTHDGIAWAKTLSVDSKLPWVMLVTPQTGLKRTKRTVDLLPAAPMENNSPSRAWKRLAAPPPSKPQFEKGPVQFAYGSQSWDTSSSACNVGRWDNGNANDFFGALIFGDEFVSNRQMDCKFNC